MNWPVNEQVRIMPISRDKSARWRNQQGAILILTTVGLTVLLGFMALGIDVGYFRHQQRRMQSAADAAALAGASQVNDGTATAASLRDATLNGFTRGWKGTTITVNNPPASGPNVGKNSFVEVIISQTQPTYFARVLGVSSVPVTARAVAQNSGAKSRYCIYALNPSRSGSANIDGGDALISNCGVVVDSNSSTAATSSGRLEAPLVSIVGNYSGSISAPTIRTGIIPVSDPLAYVQAPAVGACSQTNFAIKTGVATLNPGVYCGGITISNDARVTVNPGTYILAGGGLTVTGNGSLIGSSVTFYNTRGASAAYKPLFTQDGANLRLSAPTTGPLAGMLFFQDRNISSNALNILGGGGGLEGALYFPTTALSWSSQQTQAVKYTIIVADTFSVNINVLKVNNDYSSLDDGSPIKATVLSE